jgi:hypothetical protein
MPLLRSGGRPLPAQLQARQHALLRQQLKWLTRGALLAVVPFTLFYAIPFLLRLAALPSLADQSGGLLDDLSAADLQLGHHPLPADGHRPDLQARRGLHAGHRPDSRRLLRHHRAQPDCCPQRHAASRCARWGGAHAILLVAAIFEPLKRKIQSWVDRVFDRQRYDYRKALIEFGRGLSSETDLNALLESIVEQLPRTLLVARVAVFLARSLAVCAWPPRTGCRRGAGRAQSGLDPTGWPWAFLDFDRPPGPLTSSSKTRKQPCICPDQQRTAALLDLNYYLPCRVQHEAGRAHHRRHRPGPHHRRRLPLQRRRRVARIPGQLHRHRAAERQPLRAPGRENRRVRAAEGVQREHRRVDQRRHSGPRPRRPHRELERADGGHVRPQPRRGHRPGASLRLSRGVHRGSG